MKLTDIEKAGRLAKQRALVRQYLDLSPVALVIYAPGFVDLDHIGLDAELGDKVQKLLMDHLDAIDRQLAEIGIDVNG